MKKFIAIIAAIALIATMSVSVFADTLTAAGTVEKTVKATYVGKEAGNADEICVDVAWTDVDFEYTVQDKIWNENDLVWEDSQGEWSDDEAKVTVTNRSSCKVDIDVAYVNAVVAAEFDKDSATMNVGTAKTDSAAAVPTTEVFTLTVTEDAIDATVAEAGKITVTVAKWVEMT